MQIAIAARSPAQPFPYPAAVVSRSATPDLAGGRRRFGRDQEIYSEGGDTEYFYKVVSGLVRTYKLLNDGRRQIDAFHFTGDVFGLEPGDEQRTSAEAVGETVVVAYRRSSLKSMPVNDNAFSDEMLAAMTRRLERAQNHMLVLGCKNAQEKIATFLLGLAGRLSTSDRVELPMMRADIADYLGLTIETVSRTMAELAREGVICIDAGHRKIGLKDLGALRRLSA